jgi:hypothetical protein
LDFELHVNKGGQSEEGVANGEAGVCSCQVLYFPLHRTTVLTPQLERYREGKRLADSHAKDEASHASFAASNKENSSASNVAAAKPLPHPAVPDDPPFDDDDDGIFVDPKLIANLQESVSVPPPPPLKQKNPTPNTR